MTIILISNLEHTYLHSCAATRLMGRYVLMLIELWALLYGLSLYTMVIILLVEWCMRKWSLLLSYPKITHLYT